VVGLDPADPIEVSYTRKVGDEPTGRENPKLLRMGLSEGHDGTIIDGISRIGFMRGGKSARWTDEDIADTITAKAVQFIEKHREERFFLYFATADIHVPRVPHARFAEKSGMGPRGDVILQLDWCVGEITKTLERLNLADNTLVIFSSDNGPVLDDGYRDDAVERLGGHKPAGPLRGGKYSAFDAGTRVPLIVRWPSRVKPGTSDALVGQTDFLASLARLVNQPLPADAAPDSLDVLPALLGESPRGLDHLVEQANALSIIQGQWKFIEPHAGPRINRGTNTELGNDPKPQLYDLSNDIGEKHNVASQHPEEAKALAELLNRIRTDGRSR
jgi:arylsulfatase A-like enzyme